MTQSYTQNQINQKASIEEDKICNLLWRIYPIKIYQEGLIRKKKIRCNSMQEEEQLQQEKKTRMIKI